MLLCRIYRYPIAVLIGSNGYCGVAWNTKKNASGSRVRVFQCAVNPALLPFHVPSLDF